MKLEIPETLIVDGTTVAKNLRVNFVDGMRQARVKSIVFDGGKEYKIDVIINSISKPRFDKLIMVVDVVGFTNTEGGKMKPIQMEIRYNPLKGVSTLKGTIGSYLYTNTVGGLSPELCFDLLRHCK